MKRVFYTSLAFFTACALFSCSLDGTTKNSDSSLSSKVTAAYTSDNDIFALDYDSGALVVTGDLGGKSVYYVNVNTSKTDIDSAYVKRIASSDSKKAAIDSSAEPNARAFSAKNTQKKHNHAQWFNWKPKNDALLQDSADSNRTIDNPVAVKNVAVTQITDYRVGETAKTVWTIAGEQAASSLSDEDSYEWEQKTAVLYACNETCNVWVVSDDTYLSDTASRTQTAQDIADAFGLFYPVVRNVFGNESDEIYYPSGRSYKPVDMEYLSDTGTKVNIVLYDLYGDGTDGDTLGFFAGMDYYPSDADYQKITGSTSSIGSNSNEGKYFYLDTYFATTEPAQIVSTLAHEFQHMILFGVKTMNYLDMDTNLNEMLSMLCEDMMQNFLTEHGWEVSDEDSPRSRLLEFMVRYYLEGIREYDGTSLSYANAYAFGAWLCRQYGGAALVRAMMSNDKENNSCIVAAVNSLNGTSYSFQDLFAQFIKACIGKDSTYTFNRDAATSVTYSSGSVSYDYPMSAINLWESGSLYDLSTRTITSLGQQLTWKAYLDKQAAYKGQSLLDSAYSYFGPAVFAQGAYLQVLPASYGMLLCRKASTIPAGTQKYTLTFTTESGKSARGLTTFVYIK